MRENTIKTIWKSGGAVINGWLGIPSSVAAENMAQAQWDSLTVDLQHGLVDYQTAVTMLQAISTTATIPLARVPWMEPGIIMKLLDAGAYGIICPMINSRAECEAFVGACRYAPAGYRSFGPVRAGWYGGADYYAHANNTVLAIAMIETKQAVERIDEILTVPGLDGLYVGPNDLAITLGCGPSGVPTDKTVLDAIKTIAAAGKRYGIPSGIHCGSTQMAKEMIAIGYQFVTLLADNAFLAAAAKSAVNEMRTGSAGPKAQGSY
ncbi:MAG TPA: aldolase/citrate lyase family protein [Burkholderiales bacterium]|nr:aldolase/citrate lyase family protein [Burkholderiales bacterium]